MHMSKPTPVPIVKGNSFGNLSVPGTNVKQKQSHMLQLLKLYKRASKELTLTQFVYPGYFGKSTFQRQITGIEIENVGLMLSWKDQVLSKGCEYKSRTCEMCSEIHNCR